MRATFCYGWAGGVAHGGTECFMGKSVRVSG